MTVPSSLYQPLNRGLDEIRLLRLHPRHHSSDLPSCTLFPTQSDSQDHQSDSVLQSRLLFQQKRKYNALSYVWGNAARLSPILVNDVEVMVDTNLATCLRQLTSNVKDKSQKLPFLWVDAIYINQNDVIEQGIQVKRMGVIYSSAETVIVWIGVPRVESDALTLRDILCKLDWTERNVDFRSLDSEWPVWSDDNSVRIVNQFFLKEWWRRTWVFQEIVLAKSIRLHYGTVSITWDAIDSAQLQFFLLDTNFAVSLCPIPYGARKAMARVAIINTVRDRRACGLKVRLTQLLYLDRLSFCSDPRDRIYALLGLAEDRDTVSPDYTKSVQLALQDAVQSLIEKKRSLNIICMLPKLRRIDHDGLPSWVPDFTITSSPRDLMSFLSKDPDECHAYIASGTMPFSGVQVEAGVLSAKGLILDIVDGMGSATVMTQSNLLERLSTIFFPVHTSLQQSTTDNSRYPTKDDLLHAICNTLVSSRTGAETKVTSASEAVYLMLASAEIPKEKWPFEDIWKWDRLDEVRLIYAKNAMLKFAGKSFSDWIFIATESFEPNFDASVNDANVELKDLPERAEAALQNERFLVTASGYIGHVPDDTRRGDAICILYGMDVPVVLRQNQDQTFEVIGPCYVHGVMEGELMDDMQNGVFDERVFNLA